MGGQHRSVRACDARAGLASSPPHGPPGLAVASDRCCIPTHSNISRVQDGTNGDVLVWLGEGGGARRAEQCSGVSLPRMAAPHGLGARRGRVVPRGGGRGVRGRDGARALVGYGQPVLDPLLRQVRNFRVLELGEESRARGRSRRGVRGSVVSSPGSLGLGAIDASVGARGGGGPALSEGSGGLSTASAAAGRLPTREMHTFCATLV